MSTSVELNILEKRAFFFQKVRSFFQEKNILEVDTTLLNPFAPIDSEIEVIKTPSGYLHTSPEYEIKKLLAKIQKDLYQMSHVFRKNEKGSKHSEEFMMVEWYRINQDYFSFIKEVIEFCQLFIPCKKETYIPYDDAFKTYAQLDLTTATNHDFKRALTSHKIQYSNGLNLKDLVLTHIIEPNFPKNTFVVLYDYPKEEAALAKTYHNGKKEVAKRFEIYYQGLELANGYDELAEKKVLETRLQNEQELYEKNFGEKLSIDRDFCLAMDTLPQCCGVAVGFDRLLMLSLNKTSIAAVRP